MAAVLERHLGYRASWPALAVASYVAASRLVDNRHFLSDVVFGAALGEAVGWTIVGRHGRSQYALQPVPLHGGMMLALVRARE
jgi:membrane-associated phospholipid phosphatase